MITRDYIKKIVVDRLSSPSRMSYVETEVAIREGKKLLGKVAIVVFEFTLKPQMTSNITAIDVNVFESNINSKTLEEMLVKRAYAHKTFFCLPKSECSSEVAALCKEQGIGLLGINTLKTDGPTGMLTTIVEHVPNQSPKKWIDLYLRLEKRGVPIDIFNMTDNVGDSTHP